MENETLEAAGVFFHLAGAEAARDRLNAAAGEDLYKVVAITHKHSYVLFFVTEN